MSGTKLALIIAGTAIAVGLAIQVARASSSAGKDKIIVSMNGDGTFGWLIQFGSERSAIGWTASDKGPFSTRAEAQAAAEKYLKEHP